MGEISGEYDYGDIDEALAELRGAAGLVPLEPADSSWKLWDREPTPTPEFNPFADISPELRFLATMYFRRKASFEEVVAPDRLATINKIRREGRV